MASGTSGTSGGSSSSNGAAQMADSTAPPSAEKWGFPLTELYRLAFTFYKSE